MNLSVEVSDVPGPRVLLVEDDGRVRDFLGDCLELLGCVVTAVAAGEDALAAVRAREFDLVLSDINLPDIDGRELVREMKAAKPSLALILITGSLEDLQEQSRELGARLLVKPVAVDALCSAVRQALEPAAPAGR